MRNRKVIKSICFLLVVLMCLSVYMPVFAFNQDKYTYILPDGNEVPKGEKPATSAHASIKTDLKVKDDGAGEAWTPGNNNFSILFIRPLDFYGCESKVGWYENYCVTTNENNDHIVIGYDKDSGQLYFGAVVLEENTTYVEQLWKKDTQGRNIGWESGGYIEWVALINDTQAEVLTKLVANNSEDLIDELLNIEFLDSQHTGKKCLKTGHAIKVKKDSKKAKFGKHEIYYNKEEVVKRLGDAKSAWEAELLLNIAYTLDTGSKDAPLRDNILRNNKYGLKNGNFLEYEIIGRDTDNALTESGREDMTGMLNRVAAELEKDPNKYPLLSALEKTSQTEEEIVTEQVDQWVENELKGNNLHGDYGKWAVAIGNYFRSNGQETSITYDGKTYALESYKGEGLEEEEDLRLQVYFKLCAAFYKTSIYVNYAISKNFKLDTTQEIAMTDLANIDAETAVRNVQSVMDKKYRNYASITNEIVCMNAEDLAIYLLGRCYVSPEEPGVTPSVTPSTPATPNTAPDISGVEVTSPFNKNEFLEQMCDELVNNPSLIVGLGTYLEQIKVISKVIGNAESYNAYMAIQHMYLIMNYWAQHDGGFTYDDEKQEWKHNEIDAFLAQDPDKDANVNKYAGKMKAFFSIQRALNYLKIEPRDGTVLAAVCEYANKLVTWEDSESYLRSDLGLNQTESMRMFFSIEDRQFSDDYLKGIALSATFIPMQTNLYDVYSLTNLDDMSWVPRFHYGWGFYRKALYIDTNVNSVTDEYVKGHTHTTKGETHIATLNDLLQPERDISLYVDDRFYNVNKLAEIQNKVYDKAYNSNTALANDNEITIADSLGHWMSKAMDLDIESVVKTGGNTTYSNVAKRWTKGYTVEVKDQDKYNVLTSDKIDEYLNVDSTNEALTDYHDEYSPLQSFAVVSAIYRQNSLFSMLRNNVTRPKPVFTSSPTLYGINGVSLESFNTVYNYIMLKNLEDSMNIDYMSTLDKTSPLYIDVYGNISTESGIVVIPAASNATLYKPEQYNIYNSGFMYLYQFDNFKFDVMNSNARKYLPEAFESVDTSGCFDLRPVKLTPKGMNSEVYINFKNLNVSDKSVPKVFMNMQTDELEKNSLKFQNQVYLITEVLRGAPMENIDTEFECIKGSAKDNRMAVYMANKLEHLIEELLPSSNSNSLITLPNLAFMNKVEYAILFLAKIVCVILLFLLMYRLYHDAIDGNLGLKSAAAFCLSMIMFLVTAFSIPMLMDVSYYQVNKRMLQNETQYIAMLDLEKKSDGREITMSEVTSPSSKTQLYIKMDDVSIPWYNLLGEVILNSTFKTVSAAYDAQFDNSPMSKLPGVERKGNGIYMSLSNIWEDSQVYYEPENNILYTSVTGTPYASYVVPYYAILDNLVYRVNEYNLNMNSASASIEVKVGGRVKTNNLIEPYLTSDLFMEHSQDCLGLKYIYGIETSLVEYNGFTDEDIDKMHASYWYADHKTSERQEEIIDKLNNDARAFVVNNRELLGKVSDDIFLKVMAMSMAVKHNERMGINSGSAIEIYDIDAKDIIRLSVAPKSLVMRETAKSFSRFIFDNGGAFGVLLTAILIGIYYCSVLVKPLCIALIIVSSIVSLVFRRLVVRDKTRSVEGFAITLAILCGINALYALVLKLSISLVDIGLTMSISIILQCIIQIAYIAMLGYFTSIVLSDWKDYGFNTYSRFASNVISNNIHSVADKAEITANNVKAKLRGEVYGGKNANEGRDNSDVNRGYSRASYETGSDLLRQMKERDERRLSNRGKK